MSGAVPGLGLLCLYLKQQIGALGTTLSAIDRLRHDNEQVERLELADVKAYAASGYKGSVDDLASE